MNKKRTFILYIVFLFLFAFLIFIYFITRNSHNLLAQEVVVLYENNIKTTSTLETNLSELDKRYFNHQLGYIPQWDNFSFTGAQVVKTKQDKPVLLLWYQNNSYQSPLMVFVYADAHIKDRIIKPYQKWNTNFITYKDYEMPIYQRDGFTYVAICAFNVATHLNGAIDLNREKDWQFTLRSIRWVDIRK